jgi:glutaredoxin-related protein
MTPDDDGKKWKVYGTKTCGWTVKQLDYMNKKGKAYTFIDCANGGKCDGMNGFPTLVDPNGVKSVGYTEM